MQSEQNREAWRFGVGNSIYSHLLKLWVRKYNVHTTLCSKTYVNSVSKKEQAKIRNQVHVYKCHMVWVYIHFSCPAVEATWLSVCL